MRCARCHRRIKRAYVTAGGMVFGPTCGAIMGLVPAVQQVASKPQRAVKVRFKAGPANADQLDFFEWLKKEAQWQG